MNSNFKFRILLLSLFAITQLNTAANYKQDQFKNLLDIHVGALMQPTGFIFTDLGDWHGYGLNNAKTVSNSMGFRGPGFIASRNLGLKWLSEGFENISLKQVNGSPIPFQKVTASEYLPGQLQLSMETADLKVSMREIAISNRTTLTEYAITNASKTAQTFTVNLSGAISYSNALLSTEKGMLIVAIEGGKHHFVFSLPTGCKIVSQTDKAYTAESMLLKLAPGKTIQMNSFCSFYLYEKKDGAVAKHTSINKKNVLGYFAENKKRWEGYLNKILAAKTVYMQNDRNRNWAVKSLMTLTTNWRSAAGDLKHDGVVPATNHFDAFWAWDSWEHAAAVSVFNPDLAKSQMKTMFDYQTPEGMIVDLICADKKENNNLCSKPPVAGWATYLVYQRTKDKQFVKEMFPKLMKFHEWRFNYRDHDKNGLCEFGGTEPHVYIGQWESGMDVAVKFDGVKFLQNGPNAYSMDQESVELNCYLCAEKFYLASLADVIGEKATALKLRAEGKKLKKMIQDLFFDAETGYFYDRKVGSGELVKVIDISGWIPLFTKVATPAQAEAVKNNMLNAELFGTYFPFSTLNHKHPLYNPGAGYFRGQTWLNYTYFGIRGFKNYGYKDEAQKFTSMIPDKFKGIADAGYPIRESYNSATGEGLDATHFSWSSAFSLLMLVEDADQFNYIAE